MTGQVFAIASKSPELQADRHSCKQTAIVAKQNYPANTRRHISRKEISQKLRYFNTCFENFGLISDNEPRRFFYQTANVLSAMAIKCYFYSKVD